jgi:hypothetical protein
MKNKYWYIWCKSLGNKISDCNNEADIACLLRTGYALLIIITSIFIIANALHHW